MFLGKFKTTFTSVNFAGQLAVPVNGENNTNKGMYIYRMLPLQLLAALGYQNTIIFMIEK